MIPPGIENTDVKCLNHDSELSELKEAGDGFMHLNVDQNEEPDLVLVNFEIFWRFSCSTLDSTYLV